MANATVVLYLVHEDYAIDRTVVLHSTVPVVVEHVVVLHMVAPSCCTGILYARIARMHARPPWIDSDSSLSA